MDDLGLSIELKYLWREFSPHAGIHAHFRSDDLPDSIPRNVAGCLYYRVTVPTSELKVKLP
jgi:signal transduction histidine kinase